MGDVTLSLPPTKLSFFQILTSCGVDDHILILLTHVLILNFSDQYILEPPERRRDRVHGSQHLRNWWKLYPHRTQCVAFGIYYFLGIYLQSNPLNIPPFNNTFLLISHQLLIPDNVHYYEQRRTTPVDAISENQCFPDVNASVFSGSVNQTHAISQVIDPPYSIQLYHILYSNNNLVFIHTIFNCEQFTKVRAVSSLRTTPHPSHLTRLHLHTRC